MTTSETYVSFLVRMWRERSVDQPETTTGWQSEIEHIQTGRRYTFRTPDELLGFLRRQAEDQMRPGEATRQADAPPGEIAA